MTSTKMKKNLIRINFKKVKKRFVVYIKTKSAKQALQSETAVGNETDETTSQQINHSVSDD